jgi:molecular chaperone GrpE
MAEQDSTEQKRDDSVVEGSEIPKQLPELTELDLLSTKVMELESAVNQYKDQLLRKAAEFENYKKRTESDYASLVKFSTEDLIIRLLPVLDDFERSMKARKTSEVQGGTSGDLVFTQGVELIQAKLLKILEGQGLKAFDSVGKPFDPNLHDALLQLPRPDVPPHTVIEEVDKGFLLNDKVIRHARVIVSTDAQADAGVTASEQD